MIHKGDWVVLAREIGGKNEGYQGRQSSKIVKHCLEGSTFIKWQLCGGHKNKKNLDDLGKKILVKYHEHRTQRTIGQHL